MIRRHPQKVRDGLDETPLSQSATRLSGASISLHLTETTRIVDQEKPRRFVNVHNPAGFRTPVTLLNLVLSRHGLMILAGGGGVYP